MGSVDLSKLVCAAGDERIRYFPRQLLTADDMLAEQEYFREKLRRHNRLVHGWGRICGLEVKADSDTGPLAIKIEPGYALTPSGDEIYLPKAVSFDLSPMAAQQIAPCEPTSASGSAPNSPLEISLLIRFADRPARPLRALPIGCGCDDTACEYSRLADGIELRCATASKASSTTSPCEHLAAPPTDWLELAKMTLKSSGTGAALTLDPASITQRDQGLGYVLP